jgi:hypothetical protein
MSTKIYNGYKIKAQSLDEAIEKLYALKEKAEVEVEKQALENILSKAMVLYEEHCFLCINNNTEALAKREKEMSKNALSNALSQDLDKISKNEDVDKEISLNLIIYPHKFTENNQSFYLFQEYTLGCNALHDWVKNNLSEVEEYMYFNNTDRPDEVSDLEWEQRYENWNTVTTGAGKTGIPKIDGLGLFLGEQKLPYFFKPKNHEDQIPEIIEKLNTRLTLEKRVREYLRNFIVSFMIKEEIRRLKNEGLEDKDINHQVGSIYVDACENYREGNYHEHLKVIKTELEKDLRKALKNFITLEDLQKPFIDVKSEIEARLSNNRYQP